MGTVATHESHDSPAASLANSTPFETDSRIEELNLYIRQQSQEYLEGQAEWSRQIAEVRSECLREVEKVRREKDEVERQARQELMRLNHRLREHGVTEDPVSNEA